MKTTILFTTALLAAAGLAHSAEPFSLTKDNLGEVLSNLGFRPEKVNEKRYRMQTDRGGIKFTVSASISNDGTEVWLNTYVAEIADIAKLPVGVVTS